MKKETGNVQYYSYKKLGQFDFKIRNQEKKLHKNLERQKKKENQLQQKNNNTGDLAKNNINEMNSRKTNKFTKQRTQSEKSKKPGTNVFERLCGAREGVEEEEEVESQKQKFRTKAGEEFYKSILPFKNNLRQLKLQALSHYKQQQEQARENFEMKNSVLN